MSFPKLNDPEQGIPRVKITKTREGVLTVGLILQKCRGPREVQLMATNVSSNQVPPQDEDRSPVFGRRRSLRHQARRSLPDATVWYPHKGRSQRSNSRNGTSFDPPSSTGCPLHSPSCVDHDSLEELSSDTVASSSSKNGEGIAVPTSASSSLPQDTANSTDRAVLAAKESHGDPQNNAVLSQEAEAGNQINAANETEDVSSALAQDCPLPFDVVDVDTLSDIAEAPNNESTSEIHKISTIKVECTDPVYDVKDESTEETGYYSGPLSLRNSRIALYRNLPNRRARGSTALTPAMVCTQVQTVIHVECEPGPVKIENEDDLDPLCWYCPTEDDIRVVDVIAVQNKPIKPKMCKLEEDDIKMITVKKEECGLDHSDISDDSSQSSEEDDPLGETNCPRTDATKSLAILGIIDSSSLAAGNGSENKTGGPFSLVQNEDGDSSMQMMPDEKLDAADEGEPPKDKLEELMESADSSLQIIEPMDMTDGLASLMKKDSDDSKSSKQKNKTSFAAAFEDNRVQDAQNAPGLPEGGVACSTVSVQGKISPRKCNTTNVLVQVHQPTSGNQNDAGRPVYIAEEHCSPYGYQRFIPWRDFGAMGSGCHARPNHCHHDHLHHDDRNHHVHEVHHHHHYHHYHHHHDHQHGPFMNSTNTHNHPSTPGAPAYVMVSTQCKKIVKTNTWNQSQGPSSSSQALAQSATLDSTSSALPHDELHSGDGGKIVYPYLDYIADRTVCQGFHPVEVKLIDEELARNGRLTVQLFQSHHHLVGKLTGLTSFRHLEALREYLPQIEPLYCSTAQEEFLLFMIKLCTNCSNRDLARWSGLSEEDAEDMFLEVVTSLARGMRDSPQYLWPTTAHLEANMAWRAGAETPDSFTRLPMGCEDELDLKKNYCGLEHVFRVLKQDLAEYASDVLGLCHSLYIINQMLQFRGFYPAADDSVCHNCKDGPYASIESGEHDVA